MFSPCLASLVRPCNGAEYTHAARAGQKSDSRRRNSLSFARTHHDRLFPEHYRFPPVRLRACRDGDACRARHGRGAGAGGFCHDDPTAAALVAGRCAGATTAPATVSVDELDRLVKTLKDNSARKDFVANLEALIKAKRAEDKAVAQHPPLSDRIAGVVALHIERLSARMGHVLGVLKLAPRLVDWAQGQMMIPAKRDRLIGLIWRFIVIVGFGMAVQYGFRKTTGGARAAPREGAARRGHDGTCRALRRAHAYALPQRVRLCGGRLRRLCRAAHDRRRPSAVLLVGASSFFAAKLILATARVFLSPGVPGLRLGEMSDETANYLYIWVRRLVRIFVYAFFLLEAVRIVGLPEPAHNSLMYLVGLALVGFLIVFVLQNRNTVAAAIRGAGRHSLGGSARARIAGLWHLARDRLHRRGLSGVAVPGEGRVRVPDGGDRLDRAGAGAGQGGGDDRPPRARPRAHHRQRDGGALSRTIEERANRYMPVFRSIIRWVVYLGAALVVLDAWGVDTLGWLGFAGRARAAPEGR